MLRKCPECGGTLLLTLDEVMGRSWDCEKCDFTFDEDFDSRHGKQNGKVDLELDTPDFQ